MSCRGGRPVGQLNDLTGVEAEAVKMMRRWSSDAEGQKQLAYELSLDFGQRQGRAVFGNFEHLSGILRKYGRRALVRHSENCTCLGADEACFANLVATAAAGEYEDAAWIASLFVRPDMAAATAQLAREFGLAISAARREAAMADHNVIPFRATVH